MARGVEWVLGLLDKTSGPATSVDKKLAMVEQRLRNLDKLAASAKTPKSLDRIAFQRMGLDLQRDQLLMERTKKSTETWLTTLHSGLGVVKMIAGFATSIASAFVNAGLGAGRMAFSFARFAVGKAAEKESQVFALQSTLGSRSAASGFVSGIDRIASSTPFDDGKLLGVGRQLLGAGYSASDATALVEALANAGASTGFDPAKLDTAVEGLRRFAITGKWTDKIAKTMNEAGFSLTAAKGGIRAIAKEGLLARAGAAQAGSESTLNGLMAVTRNRFDDLFEDLYKSPALNPLRAMLKNLNRSLGGAGGSALKGSIERALGSMFRGVFGDGMGVASLDKWLERLGRGLEVGSAALGGLFSGLKSGLLDGLRPLVGDLSSLFDGAMTPEKLAKISLAFKHVGEAIGGAAAALVRLAAMFTEMVNDTPAWAQFWVKNWNKMSQSEGFGGKLSTAFGLNEGPSLPVSSGAVGGALAAGAFGTTNGTAQVYVDARGATKDDADAIASKTKAATQDGIATALTKAATSQGAI